jgi:hypothetical protein
MFRWPGRRDAWAGSKAKPTSTHIKPISTCMHTGAFLLYSVNSIIKYLRLCKLSRLLYTADG